MDRNMGFSKRMVDIMKIYEKKTKDILKVTDAINEFHETEETRAEIQTKIDHLELDKVELQKEIDEQKIKIAILDA